MCLFGCACKKDRKQTYVLTSVSCDSSQSVEASQLFSGEHMEVDMPDGLTYK